MSIRLRALCLALIGTLMAVAMVTGSASAETGGHFTALADHVELKGEDVVGAQPAFVAFGQEVKCNESSYSATLNEVDTTATEVTATPTYHKCEVTSLETLATVNMNGCDYVFTVAGAAGKHSTTHLVCPGSKGPVVTAEGASGHCTLEVTPNTTPTQGVVYETGGSGSSHDVTVNLTVTGVHTLRLAGGFFACGTFSSTDGSSKLDGKVTVKGFDTEGSQVGITATEGISPEIHSEVDHTLITGSQVNANTFTFGIFLGNVECEVVTYDGTAASKTVSSLTVKAASSKCEGFEREVTFHMNGCAYVLTPTAPGTDGVADIECPAGQAIELTYDAFPEGCTLTLGAQSAGGVVDLKGEGSGATRDLLVTWTLEKIKYKRDGCEVGGEGNNGTLTGTVTLKGEDTSGNQKGIWIE